MPFSELALLSLTAVGIGTFHTLLGPDHYVPFVALARVRSWSLGKTLRVALVCGTGHLGGSILLGILGITLGLAVNRLEGVEGFRGDTAAWMLTTFGIVYLAWGLRKARKEGRGHSHSAESGSGRPYTVWVIFIIFAFGPCEPLIPLLVYPAAEMSLWAVAWVVLLFSAATLLSMALGVFLIWKGLGAISTSKLSRYSHALAGGAILLCAVMIHLGL